MADLLAVPMKKPSEIDIVKPLKNLISSSYSTADNPQDYGEAISELSKLRNNAIWRVYEKYESSLEIVYSYYDQLCGLEGKIPSHEVQIPFKWKDAFNKGSIFGGKISLTVSSLSYEKVCVLFNIAALQSSVAVAQSIENDDGLKLAAKMFQQAAGIFSHLKGNVMLAIQQDPTPDLNPETLGALSALMLAQGQEIFVQKAIHDKMKDAVIAKLSSQCEELYVEVLKLFQKELLRPLWDKEWIPTVAGKQAAYHGLAEYYQSLVCKANKSVGEEIARLEHALELFKAAQQRSGKPSFFQDYANKSQRNLTEAKKDNDFIYHERIPDVKSLPPVGKALLAKTLPVPERLSQNFKDLFVELVPVTVHQALAAYDVRKNEIVNSEIMKLRESTQLLNSVLASLNLPAALEDTSESSLPQSLVEKASAVRNNGGIQELERMIQELPELLQRNKDILDETERMVRDEKESDDQLRNQFKERWTRTPSDRLTETFRANMGKYREIINNAMQADKVIRDKFESHRRGMELLTKGPTEMLAAVPSAGPGGSNVQNSSAVHHLRKLMEDVETIKAERDTVECELKSATADMKSTFLNALAQDGAINEQAMSVESLGRVFGPLQRQVKESLQKQEALVADIQVKNTEFCKEKSGVGAAAERETVLKELAAAHDAFIELKGNLSEGEKFYNDLTQILVGFQNKISDFCFARKTEKEELMKDLTQSIGRETFGATPAIPGHHTPTQEGKKQPPPRPPPPTSTSGSAPSVPPPSTLPYPSYPQGMPVPYAATQAAPYPAYMPSPVLPAGYNPYAVAPYPQQGYGGFPAYPQPPYSGYPYSAQQQQPPQNRPW
ncbi:programmed cell death 6-interacting protein [Zootermopsis nevadensis]|uniref:Programmed cell death 6-interacting protein n=1 Tax=Zootermopsis nevadensis TaxID=136037 RepID=A0A067RRI5_ZOONE|nr:programmed cell death 6-interacting protein [Zootermopsis nevadensis]KDR23230.1 Programmed cell death 6-interacting protein [Zootermopsis nevadensis]